MTAWLAVATSCNYSDSCAQTALFLSVSDREADALPKAAELVGTSHQVERKVSRAKKRQLVATGAGAKRRKKARPEELEPETSGDDEGVESNNEGEQSGDGKGVESASDSEKGMGSL